MLHVCAHLSIHMHTPRLSHYVRVYACVRARARVRLYVLARSNGLHEFLELRMPCMLVCVCVCVHTRAQDSRHVQHAGVLKLKATDSLITYTVQSWP